MSIQLHDADRVRMPSTCASCRSGVVVWGHMRTWQAIMEPVGKNETAQWVLTVHIEANGHNPSKKKANGNFFLHQKAGNCWVPLWQWSTCICVGILFQLAAQRKGAQRENKPGWLQNSPKPNSVKQNRAKAWLGSEQNVGQLCSQASSRASTVRNGW